MSIYKFCEKCEYIKSTYFKDKLISYTCPARFNPFEPPFEPDGSPRTDGREGCPKHEKFMRLERLRDNYVTTEGR